MLFSINSDHINAHKIFRSGMRMYVKQTIWQVYALWRKAFIKQSREGWVMCAS